MGFPINAIVYGLNGLAGLVKMKADSYGRQVGIEIEHQEIHEGNFYRMVSYDSDVDIATPKTWAITAPADKELHARVEMQSGPSGGVWTVYSDPTIDAAGTAIPIINQNTNSAKATTATAVEDCTTTDDGTLFDPDLQGASGANNRLGGDGSWRDEIVIAPGLTFLFRFTPAANDTKAVLKVLYYEVTP